MVVVIYSEVALYIPIDI